MLFLFFFCMAWSELARRKRIVGGEREREIFFPVKRVTREREASGKKKIALSSDNINITKEIHH
jgi:hypothetical protein